MENFAYNKNCIRNKTRVSYCHVHWERTFISSPYHSQRQSHPFAIFTDHIDYKQGHEKLSLHHHIMHCLVELVGRPCGRQPYYYIFLFCFIFYEKFVKSSEWKIFLCSVLFINYYFSANNSRPNFIVSFSWVEDSFFLGISPASFAQTLLYIFHSLRT